MPLHGAKSRHNVAVAQPDWGSGYRTAVQRLISVFDRPESAIGRSHPGRIAGGWWEVQLLIRGTVGGMPAAVAVERHRCARRPLGPLDEGCVDSFRIMLAEVGLERGVLFSYTGFSTAAGARATAVRDPDVLAISLGTPYESDLDRPNVHVATPRAPGDREGGSRVREANEVTIRDFAVFVRGPGASAMTDRGGAGPGRSHEWRSSGDRPPRG